MAPLSPKKSTGGSKNLLNLLTSVHPFLGIFEAAQFFFDFLLTLAKSPVEKSHLTIFSDAPLASFLAWQIWEKSPSIVDVFEALGIIQDTTKHIWAHQPKMFDSTIRHLTIFRERTVNTYTILHYTFLSSVSLVEAINMGTSPMRMDLSWFIRFFDAAMKLDLESSHFYSKLPRCQQRCQPVPCRTWGMTPPGVLSCDRCDGVDLTVVKLGWVSCWHFCLVVHVVANMHHLLVN